MKPEKGYIYIVTNPMMTGYIKIGYAKDINERLRTFNTGSIKDYEPYAAYEVYSYQVDKQIHGIIELLNPRLRVPNKEFFRMEPEEAYELLQRIAKITSTEDRLYKYVNGKPQREMSEQIVIPEVEEIKEESKTEIKTNDQIKRKCHFKFSLTDLNPGDIIISTINGEEAIVKDYNNHILFRNEMHTLTSACQLINKEKTGIDASMQGPLYWSRNNVILDLLRKDI